MEKVLEQIAEKLITLDEASLTRLLPKYKAVMEKFEPTEEWEKAVIIFFMINSVRVKNSLFNDNIVKNKDKSKKIKNRDYLKLIKS